MIWLIGKRGMLGSDVYSELKKFNTDILTSSSEIDISDYSAAWNFVKEKEIKWIVNCSGYTAVDKAEDESRKAFQINGEGVKNIAEIADKIDARLIHISTDYVFNGLKQGDYFEDDDTDPQGIYGKSKLQGEIYIERILKEYFIFRISWLFGKNGNNFVSTMIKLFRDRDEVRVVNDQWGSPTYTVELAELIAEIINGNSAEYGLYHYSCEGKINWFEFACYIYEKAKELKLIEKNVKISPITTNGFPTKAARPKNSYLSKEKIKNIFNININRWQESISSFLLTFKD